jgi:hypothetical protein
MVLASYLDSACQLHRNFVSAGWSETGSLNELDAGELHTDRIVDGRNDEI